MPSRAIKRLANYLGYDILRLPAHDPDFGDLPDNTYYRPLFSPWLGYGAFTGFYETARAHSLVSADRCWVLYCLAVQSIAVRGDFWECGVYKGGTAAMLAEILEKKSTDGTKYLHFNSGLLCIHLSSFERGRIYGLRRLRLSDLPGRAPSSR